MLMRQKLSQWSDLLSPGRCPPGTLCTVMYTVYDITPILSHTLPFLQCDLFVTLSTCWCYLCARAICFSELWSLGSPGKDSAGLMSLGCRDGCHLLTWFHLWGFFLQGCRVWGMISDLC